MNIAIIPARGGSKRIPKKNIKHFLGKPIISYPIKQAIKSKLFDRVFVSTDDQEIAKISESYGAEIPFIRSDKLSDDFTPVTKVMSDAIKWMNKNNLYSENICCILPTTPCISAKDLINGFQKLTDKNKKWSYVFTASKNKISYFRSFKLNEDKSVKMIFPQKYNSRTQELADTYYDAGQFYWGKNEAWLSEQMTFDRYSTIIELESWKSQDIDTLKDWEELENLLKPTLSKLN
jgi:pseudaminic acid cytidylyltransferase